ncbi:hypothetical protein [Pseudomonas reidholzensis]|nr:hypothetical protein [Pseudomonas reidholzensis]
MLFADQALRERPAAFWTLALGVPFLCWCVVTLGRVMHYLGQQRLADSWDQARLDDRTLRVSQGRRCLQVLGVSLYTALRDKEQGPAAQLEDLLSGAKALKTQVSWRGDAARHSQLPREPEMAADEVLLETLGRVLAELGNVLAGLPEQMPVALLLDIDSSLPPSEVSRVWQQAWENSVIRQPVKLLEGGGGLERVDQWLDQRHDDAALLMVVALQLAPDQPAGTAEAAVGLLLGNPQLSTPQTPIARLHRPQQEPQPITSAWLDTVRQSLDWVPAAADAISHTWRAGIDTQREAAITTALVELQLPSKHNQTLHDLDSTLGLPGRVAPWLAIAAAAQTIQRGAGAQLIVTGGACANTTLWSVVLTPAAPLST